VICFSNTLTVYFSVVSLGVFPYGSMSDEEVLSSALSGCTLERPTDSDPEL